jgi:hypothetical protein
VLGSAAAYLVEVSTTAADLTNVTGTASLAGTVQAVFGPGAYIARSYTILSADGGSTGTFGTLTVAGLPAGFAASLSYTGTDTILNLTAVLGQPQNPGQPQDPPQPPAPGLQPLLNFALSQNQYNVANALNAFFNNGGTLTPNFLPVFGLTGANLATALSFLSGEPATGVQQTAFKLMDQFLALMIDPFVDGRAGMNGILDGGARSFAPERCRKALRWPMPGR